MPVFRSLAALILGLAGLPGHGQRLVPGYVVTVGGDSLRGAICIRGPLLQQSRAEFVALRGTERLRLDANQLAAFGYIHQQDTVRYVAINLTYGARHRPDERVFLRQLAAGPVELYQYHYQEKTAGNAPVPQRAILAPPTAATSAHPLLRTAQVPLPPAAQAYPPVSAKGAGPGTALLLRRRAPNAITQVSGWNFPVDAAAYFADCPALATDLQARRYRQRDLPRVVKRYNAWHAGAR